MFVPNIIDYVRILLLVISVLLMHRLGYVAALPVYFGSFTLDLFDGLLARKLNQTSRYGMYLDIIIDKCGSTVLGFYLIHTYRESLPLVGAWILLDWSSHFILMIVSLVQGKKTHKSEYDNLFLRLYYSKAAVFHSTIWGEQIFLLSLFYGSGEARIVGALTVPLFAFKQIVNTQQLWVSFRYLATIDGAGLPVVAEEALDQAGRQTTEASPTSPLASR